MRKQGTRTRLGFHERAAVRRSCKRGVVEVNGERVGFTLCEIDGRAKEQRLANVATGTLDGNLSIYIPGHCQSARGASNLMGEIVAHSSSKVLWSIDIDPPTGGDLARAQAPAKIVSKRTRRSPLLGLPHESCQSRVSGVTVSAGPMAQRNLSGPLR